jgi:serine/threonine-protein kinase HipA
MLQRLAKRAGLAQGDLTRLLGILGEDAVGDVTIQSSEPSGRTLQLPVDIPFREAYRRLLDDPSLPLPIGAVAGAQPKMSADRITLPYGVTAGPGAFLKFTNDERYKEAAHNEAFFMAMAADCGLKAARVEKVRDSAGEFALLVHRFDRRVRRGKTFERLHQEDALQLLDLYPADKYDVTVEEVGEAIRKVVAAWPPTAIELILQFAFGYLIGNNDQHAKNVSILEAAPGVWALSPLYDMLSTLAHDGLQPLALKLNGKEEDLTRADFVSLAQTFGVREEAVLLRLDRMLAKALPWLDRLGEIGFDPLLTERFTGALLERHAALTG